MKKILTTLLLLVCFAVPAQTAEELKDYLIRGMTDYELSDQRRSFEQLTIKSTKPEDNEIVKTTYEGNLVYSSYNFEGNDVNPSNLQVLRYYRSAVNKLGGATLWEGDYEYHASFTRNDKQYYMRVESYNSAYLCVVNILEVADLDYDVDILEDEIIEDPEIIEEQGIVEEPEIGDDPDSINAAAIVQKLEEEGSVTLYINFDSGKYIIKPESYKVIDEIAEALKARPDMRVKLEGHTDNVGNARANKKLSDDRSNAVMEAIAAKGIDKSRLSCEGFGLERPIADNNTDEGRAKNRRVELVRVE